MKTFIHDDFLLETSHAQKLFHDYAKDLPIIDYHCHLPVDEIAGNKKFENISRVWLNGDHYKWRAMRANGIDEKYITGDASDWEKFEKWAETVPQTLRNPLYHWTHMEMKRPFGISDTLLNKNTAKLVWDRCNELLQQDNFSTRGLIKQFNVETLCSTDDPIDSLEYHEAVAKSDFSVKVLPTFRPDKGMMVDNPEVFYPWLARLEEVTNKTIATFADYIEAIRLRHDHFHAHGCRLSDHGLETAYAADYTQAEIDQIFNKIILKQALTPDEILKFKSVMLYEFGVMDHEKGWTQQLHLGALRNTNSRMYRILGPDTGYDSIGDYEVAKPLAKLLNRLDDQDTLAKTILYNLNPRDNELFATMIGNFQDGKIAGKMQFGSGWWFLDQKEGIERQMNALSLMGLLSRFVGMLTDSRSFLSYPRHEYFRRVLCNVIGNDIKAGIIPDDDSLTGPLVQNISYYNAKKYFAFDQV